VKPNNSGFIFDIFAFFLEGVVLVFVSVLAGWVVFGCFGEVIGGGVVVCSKACAYCFGGACFGAPCFLEALLKVGKSLSNELFLVFVLDSSFSGTSQKNESSLVGADFDGTTVGGAAFCTLSSA